jgi:hypothetical protein
MHGREPIEYLHPALEEITRRTYGVIVFQETVMATVRALAGYSLGEADIVRRVMGKKKREEVAKERARFMDACEREGKCDATKAGDSGGGAATAGDSAGPRSRIIGSRSITASPCSRARTASRCLLNSPGGNCAATRARRAITSCGALKFSGADSAFAPGVFVGSVMGEVLSMQVAVREGTRCDGRLNV